MPHITLDLGFKELFKLLVVRNWRVPVHNVFATFKRFAIYGGFELVKGLIPPRISLACGDFIKQPPTFFWGDALADWPGVNGLAGTLARLCRGT
jgi:hypothetical protein